jgi:hypothetical protein
MEGSAPLDGATADAPGSDAPSPDSETGADATGPGSDATSPDTGLASDATATDTGAGNDATVTDTGPSNDATATDTGPGKDATATDTGPAGDAGAVDPSVYQQHKNPTRDGVYIDPVFTQTAAATTHVLTGFMGTVTTSVYAQPLYVENGPGGVETFIVATENNHVTAYNATTGVTIWDQGPTLYGASVNGTTLAQKTCGTVNPLGITGTPYIDITSRTIFFDAMTTPDNNMTFRHKVYAVKLDDGTVLPNWPVVVDSAVTGFDSSHQNQRGALQFLNGVLYVAYSGLNGDCDPYYGRVIGFPVATPQSPISWHTTASRGGIWGPGALPTDGTSIFPVTGNTENTGGTWGGGEAVIRLTAGLTFSGKAADYYAPSLWETMDTGDEDLGGANEVLFDIPSAPKPHLVAAGGKDGNLYVLDRDNLGGIGAELVKFTVSTSAGIKHQVKGSPAVYTTKLATYFAMHLEGGVGVGCPASSAGNMVVAKITPGTPYTASIAWCTAETGLGSPMVTTTDGTSNVIVWNANTALYGYDGDTGAKIVDGTKTNMGTAIEYWNTPINAKGRMAVGVNGQLFVFTP